MNTLKILAVDDARSNLLLLKTLLGDYGHTIVTASDGLQAIQACLDENPEIILMDVNMPNMDGIEAARRIRESNKHVPIIFLSSATDAQSIGQALQFGTDFITKPIQPHQLLDKLNAHFRSILANREIIEQKKQVQILHEQLLDENRVAAHVLSRMLSRMVPPSDFLQYTVIPSSIFSGDVVLAGTTPSGRLHVILADAIGHGLPAAFTLLPLIPAFNAMTGKGFPLEDILFEINKTLKNMMPVGRFIAATAISVDFQTGACEVWVGGNPSIIILNNQTIRHIPSTHLALGIAHAENKLAFTCQSIQLSQGDQIIFFSDGLAETWAGSSLEDFILSCPPTEVFSRLQETTSDHKGHDDTSLVVLQMRKELAISQQEPPAVAKLADSRIVLDLDTRQIANPDIVHTIVDLAYRIGIVSTDDVLFGLVLSELFSNALDHGVLGLSSETKYADVDGFDAYINLREERLANLKNGYISIQIEASEFSGKPATLLRIIDSGPGFDQSILHNDGDYQHQASAGRGIKLVMNTCHKLSFAGSGNDVTAYIPRKVRPEEECPTPGAGAEQNYQI
jgi:CheY-like chemotaxis protein/anti-sigma regulatory factor (Ser/Thr protein kinase)